MERLKKLLLLLLCFGLAALLLAFTGAGRAMAESLKLVQVTNVPLPVEVTNPAPAPVPVQLYLSGIFSEPTDINLHESILGPISYTVPAGSKLLLKYASCDATIPAGVKVHIFLVADVHLPGSTGPANIVGFVPENEVVVIGAGRRAAAQPLHAYLGISTPDGPSFGDTLRLHAQKDTATGTGGVRCIVSGELFQ